MVVVTGPTRKIIWDFLCDLEMYVRYYRTKADKVQRQLFLLRFAMLTSVLVEGLLLYQTASQPWHLYVVIPVGAVMIVIVVWDTLSNYANHAAILKYVASEARVLREETQTLWRHIETYRVSEDDAEVTYKSIRNQWGRTSDRVITADDNRLVSRCAKDSNTVMRDSYKREAVSHNA